MAHNLSGPASSVHTPQHILTSGSLSEVMVTPWLRVKAVNIIVWVNFVIFSEFGTLPNKLIRAISKYRYVHNHNRASQGIRALQFKCCQKVLVPCGKAAVANKLA